MTFVRLPRSLFGQLLAALLGTVGLSLLVIVGLIARERRELAFSGSEMSAVVELIADTAISLAQLTREQRNAELQRLRAAGLVLEGSGRSEQALRPPDEAPDVARELEQRLGRALGESYGVAAATPPSGDPLEALRVRIERRGLTADPAPTNVPAGTANPLDVVPQPRGGGGGGRGGRGAGPGQRGGGPGFGLPGGRGGPQIEITVTLPDDARVPFRTEMPRASVPLPNLIFFQLGAVTVVLGVLLYFMTRTITRPLVELASAADAVGRGERHAPLPETGARELRDATRAFNSMQERLRRYLDSRTGVLAAMSHDLRTPLTRLRLRVESLPDDELRERFEADLEEMSAMVVSALQLFRGLDDHEPTTLVNVDALLATLVQEFAELGGSVSVEGRSAAPLPARAQALKRCLTNLLSNAIKYGQRARVTIEDGAELVIRIADEGPGIPEAKLERVFEPFFRLEESRNSATGGIGLGLGIARDIAQSHGGSLVLANGTPRGLVAELRLPRRNFA